MSNTPSTLKLRYLHHCAAFRAVWATRRDALMILSTMQKSQVLTEDVLLAWHAEKHRTAINLRATPDQKKEVADRLAAAEKDNDAASEALEFWKAQLADAENEYTVQVDRCIEAEDRSPRHQHC